MSTMLVQSQKIAATRGSLKIRRSEEGQAKFSFVGRDETVEFFIEVSDLIQLALGDTLLVSSPDCTLTMSRTTRTVQLHVQRRNARPVDFEMPLEKFGEMLTSLVEVRRAEPEATPAMYLN